MKLDKLEKKFVAVAALVIRLRLCCQFGSRVLILLMCSSEFMLSPICLREGDGASIL